MDECAASVADLEAEWQRVVGEREACHCKVCRLAPEVRAYVDTKLAELAGIRGGRGSVGVVTFATRVTQPKLGLSANLLTRHRGTCVAVGCAHYSQASRAAGEQPDVGV
jgi:hypothetical protein